MIFVIILDFLVVATLGYLISKKGVEGALPAAIFFLVVFPEESKLSLGLFDITTQRLVTAVLIVASMLEANTKGKRRLPLKSALIVIVAWWAIATVNSIAIVESTKSLLSLLLDYVAIYYIFAKRITNRRTISEILFGISAGLIICSFFGVLEAYANWSVVSIFPTEVHRFGASGGLYVDEARGLRVQSTFGHPILFGSALAMGVPVALYLMAETTSRFRRNFLGFGLLLMFTSIFKSGSRGPWIALGLSLGVLLFFGPKMTRRYVSGIGILTLAVLIIRPGVWETIAANYFATVDKSSSQGQSYEYRYILYKLVFDKLEESPARMLWGYGPQSFPYLHLNGSIGNRWMNFVSCDSSFAALLAETGYVGFTIMVLFLAYVQFFMIRAWIRLRSPDHYICLILLLNVATFCFEMTNVAILGWGQQTVILWAIIAMGMVYPSLCTDRAAQKRSLRPAIKLTESETIALLTV